MEESHEPGNLQYTYNNHQVRTLHVLTDVWSPGECLQSRSPPAPNASKQAPTLDIVAIGAYIARGSHIARRL